MICCQIYMLVPISMGDLHEPNTCFDKTSGQQALFTKLEVAISLIPYILSVFSLSPDVSINSGMASCIRNANSYDSITPHRNDTGRVTLRFND